MHNLIIIVKLRMRRIHIFNYGRFDLGPTKDYPQSCFTLSPYAIVGVNLMCGRIHYNAYAILSFILLTLILYESVGKSVLIG